MSVSRRLHAVPTIKIQCHTTLVLPKPLVVVLTLFIRLSRRAPSHWTWPMRRDPTVAVLLSLTLLVACSDPIARAEEALEIGDYALAEQVLTDAVRSQPRDVEIRRLLLLTYEATGQTDRALATARVLSNLDPSTANLFRLMRLEAQAGDILAAKELLDQWPSDSVSSLAWTTAQERGDTTLFFQPDFLSSLGVGDHTAGRCCLFVAPGLQVLRLLTFRVRYQLFRSRKTGFL